MSCPYRESGGYQKDYRYNYYNNYSHSSSHYNKQCPKTYEKQCPKTYEKHCPKTYEKQCPKTYEKHCPKKYEKQCPKKYEKHCPKKYEKKHSSYSSSYCKNGCKNKYENSSSSSHNNTYDYCHCKKKEIRPCDPCNKIDDKVYAQLASDIKFDKSILERFFPIRPSFLTDPPFHPQYKTPPGVYPWGTNIIPAEKGVHPGTPNNDGYDKFQSISYVLAFYVDIDMANIDPLDERITLFLTNLRDRGDENYRKKIYMWALTCDKMDKYKSKVDNFLNKVYLDITAYKKPVLGSFQATLIRFFLDVHLGSDDYPESVIKYFQYFMDITGTVDRNLDNCEWVKKMIYGHTTAPEIEKYINERLEVVLENKDDTSIIYYWSQAGLSTQSILTEALHNMIAFNQFTNILYLLIFDRINGTIIPPLPPNPPVPPIMYNFVEKYTAAAGNQSAQLNVSREIYRLLVPNSISFSRIKQAIPDTNTPIKGDHIHKLIMITQTGPTYFGYNPNIYNANYNTSFEECTPPPLPTTTPVPTFDPASFFEDSAVDNQTVQPISNNKIIPVFPPGTGNGEPTYYPFGLGYRRCAGEVFSYYVTLMMLEKFQYLFNNPDDGGNTRFKFDPNVTDMITPAPFTFIPDNIFVKPKN